MSLLEEVQSAAARLLPAPARVIIACSGGADSVALLHLLHACRAALGWELEVLSCDHGLRPESAADLQFVQALAAGLHLPFHAVSLPVLTEQRPGESLEMCARRLRLQAYADTCTRTEAAAVALAHHRDDQAETVLLRLCRGTGPRGAAGMAPRTRIHNLTLIRPLLHLPRAGLRRWLSDQSLAWREDASNATRDPRRNRIRLDLLPALADQLNPAAAAHLAGFAARQRELEDWVADEVRARLPALLRDDALQLTDWRTQPPALRQRLLHHLLLSWGADPASITAKALFRTSERLLQGSSEVRKHTFGGLTLLEEPQTLRPLPPAAAAASLWLTPQHHQHWPPLNRDVVIQPWQGWDAAMSVPGDWSGGFTAFCRPLGEGLMLRTLRPGDRIQLLGMQGHSKLSDLMINARLPQPLRSRWPIWTTAADEIVWVPGFRIHAAFAATPHAPSWRLNLGPDPEPK